MTLYYTWTKGVNKSLTPSFNTSEFQCHCSFPECIEQRINVDLVANLQKIRDDLEEALIITSGYRCERYQQVLAGKGYKTASRSTHCKGDAADISCRNMNKLSPLVWKYFMAVGIAYNFFHVDERRDKPRTWNY